MLALRLAEFLATPKGPGLPNSPTMMVTPFQKPPSWIKRVEYEQVVKWIIDKDYDSLRPGTTLILDDITTYLSIRKLGTTELNALESLVPVVRHWGEDEGFPVKGIKIIFVTQTTGFVDKYFGQGSIVFYKNMPVWYADTERGSSRKMADRAMAFLSQYDKETRKRYAWLATQGFEGPIEVSMPSTRTTYREL